MIPVEDLASTARPVVAAAETRASDIPIETSDAVVEVPAPAPERSRRSSSIAMVLPAHLLFATPTVDPQTPG